MHLGPKMGEYLRFTVGKMMINHKKKEYPTFRQTNHPVGLNFTVQLVPSFAVDIPFLYVCKTTCCSRLCLVNDAVDLVRSQS